MANTVLHPISAVPITTDRVYPNIHVCAGSGFKHIEGLGVQASVGADATWRIVFQVPQTLPTGTCKLRLLALANATSGNAKVNPKWASCAVEEDPSSLTLQAETVQTVSWSTGDNDQFKELKVTLDADTVVAGEIIVMDLVFETSSWTLAQISTWLASVIWE